MNAKRQSSRHKCSVSSIKKAHQRPSYFKYNTHFPVLTVVLRIKNRHYYDFIFIYLYTARSELVSI